MPQVSNNPLQEDTYKKIYHLFLETLNSIETKSELFKFMSELLTPTEQIMLSKRIVIAYLLEKNYKYQEIMEKIHVSSSTVSRVNLIYSNSRSMQTVIKKIVNKKQFSQLLLELGILITGVVDLPKSKTKSWKNLNKTFKNKKAHDL